MKSYLKFLAALAVALLMVLPAVATAGDKFSTVNKSIRVDDNSVTGKVDSVNGSIRVGANSVVKSVDSVNGSIKLGNGVRVEDGVDSVNGSVTLESGCEVGGKVETVNGSIRLHDTSVSGDVETVNGGIRLLDGTEVIGNVVVRKPGGWNFSKRNRPVRVEIGENVQVHGDLIFEHAVELILDGSARVGEIIGDEVTMVDN